ncbi:hypothetical protein [Aneurinibacillus aneurinilyticus]|uniref:hypothetical protein n=1 Tax=Aneurinibacillus aneurinilyticus TaxID=1391 RepID=UPI0035235775
MIIHKVEERRCTRRRVPSSFSHKEETRPLCGARADRQNIWVLRCGRQLPVDFVPGATRSTQKNKGDARRTRHSFLSIYGYQGC